MLVQVCKETLDKQSTFQKRVLKIKQHTIIIRLWYSFSINLRCRHKEIDASINDAIEIAGHFDSDMRSGIHNVPPGDIKNTFRKHYHQQAYKVWHLPLTTFQIKDRNGCSVMSVSCPFLEASRKGHSYSHDEECFAGNIKSHHTELGCLDGAT